MNCILFRASLAEENEEYIASKYFDVFNYRSLCKKNSIVIGRYSVLPYYRELEMDLSTINSSLINSYDQHNWIASFDYYKDVESYTFKSYTSYDFVYAPEGEYIVKGATNSKKHQWNRLMYAKDKRTAIDIRCKLLDDGLIGIQDIIYRQYIPLETLEVGVNGLPFSNEWRLFFYKNNLLAYGYYWSLAEDAENINKNGIDNKCLNIAKEIANIASNHVNFFVLDIAKTADGEWKLVEINDGQMSGLSMVNPDVLYKELSQQLSEL